MHRSTHAQTLLDCIINIANGQCRQNEPPFSNLCPEYHIACIESNESITTRKTGRDQACWRASDSSVASNKGQLRYANVHFRLKSTRRNQPHVAARQMVHFTFAQCTLRGGATLLGIFKNPPKSHTGIKLSTIVAVSFKIINGNLKQAYWPILSYS